MSTEEAKTEEPWGLWKCKCGKFQIKILHEPVFDMNCHCHSCVAVRRYIEEKHPGGTSAEVDGGTSLSQIAFTDIEFVGDDPCGKLGYVKVGDKGQFVRSYTKCCGTMCGTGGGASFPMNFRPLNRNALYKADGSPFEPAKKPPNTMAKFAFEPDKVPEPKSSYVPLGVVLRVIAHGVQEKLGMGQNENLKGLKAIYMDPNDVEEFVPITWEE